MSSEAPYFFIYLLGPTAVGKTEISIKIAGQYNLPIFNCDSIQVYRHLNIGSSKPSLNQRASHPHYLFDFVEPPNCFTVADYVRDVHSCIKRERLHNVFFVGGSGFYIQALEKGLYPIPEISEDIKKQVARWVEREGFESLYLWLEKRDPQWIKKVSRKDHYRLNRAVEIMKSQGQTITQLKDQMKARGRNPLFRQCSLKIGLRMDRGELKKRIEIRTNKMLEQGLIQEVNFLMEKGFGQWPPLQSVGYSEVKKFLETGNRTPESMEDLRSEIVKNTMKLVKKQMTWFKRDREIVWFTPGERGPLVDYIGNWLENRLTDR